MATIRPSDNEEAYFNRKFYHSLNVLVVSIIKLSLQLLAYRNEGTYVIILFFLQMFMWVRHLGEQAMIPTYYGISVQ